MHPSHLPCYLAMLLALVCADKAQAQPVSDPDERALREAGVASDGPGLLQFIRQHTTTRADEETIGQLVKRLGDDEFQTREDASARLASLGPRALPLLREATKNPDPEVVVRARYCVRRIEAGSAESLLLSAARLLRQRKPDGACEVLLAYLPLAEHDYLAQEMRTTLAEVTMRDGKANPAVVAALRDSHPARRTAAGIALLRTTDPETRKAVRQLLEDPSLQVRRVVALALVGAREKDALPTLIALLEELPARDTGDIEDLLYQLAGDKAPPLTAGATQEEKKRNRQSWEQWYQANQKSLDLAKLEEAATPKGNTMVVLLDVGKIIDLDTGKKVRWTVNNLNFPLDAQYLPGDRVLVAEYEGGRVSEFKSTGELLWEKKILQPLVAQRLPNGNTFIATASSFLEVDREGKTTWSITPPANGRVMKAVRLRNGNVACVTMLGGTRFYELDRDGSVVRNFPVQLSTSGGRIDVLRNGHVLIPEKEENRVVEYDISGRAVLSIPFTEPIAATRLPNGNTLVTSFQAPRAVEVDRDGKEVWEYRTETRVTRAWRH